MEQKEQMSYEKNCKNCGMPLNDCGVNRLAREVGMAVPPWCKNWKPIPYVPTAQDIMAVLGDEELVDKFAMSVIGINYEWQGRIRAYRDAARERVGKCIDNVIRKG